MRFTKLILFAVVFALLADTASGYEVLFDASVNGKSSDVHKVPIAHNCEGVIERGNVLKRAGALPDRIDFSDFNGLGRAVLEFKEGRLVRFKRDSNSEAKEKDEEYLRSKPIQMVDLWRTRSFGTEEQWRYWDKSSRLRLWFFNPNGAGTFFAQIALVLLSIGVLIFRKPILRIVFACCSIIPFVFMLLTGSRGSLVALASGIGVMVVSYMVFRKSELKRFAMMGMIGVAVVAALIFGFGGERFYKNFLSGDAGNAQRLRVWRAAPAMMVAAPNGWGDRCGYAYNEWFQAEDEAHVFQYLVNTHLTWMVGKGWTFSFFYILGWIFLLMTLLSQIRERWSAVALSSWVLFFVANWFSTLGHFGSLWVLPVFCTIPAVVVWLRGLKAKIKCFLVVGGASPLVAFCLMFGLISVGKADLAKIEVPVRKDGSVVYVGTGEPVAYVVPDFWVLCRHKYGGMGRDIRAWCKNHADGGAIAVVDSLEKLPKKMERLILVGCSCREYMSRVIAAGKDKSTFKDLPVAKNLLFVSPNLTMGKISARLARALHLNAYIGEFLAEVTGDLARGCPWVKIVPACELYLPDWMELAMQGGRQ